MTYRNTFVFDASEMDLTAVGEIMVEQYTDDDHNVTEINLAVRTDRWDTWGPPVTGTQTS